MEGEKSQYAQLLGSLRGRRQLTAEELQVIGEHHLEDHEGMDIEEEEYLDSQLLGDEDEDDVEEEEESDLPSSSAGHSLTGPMSGRKRRRFSDTVSYPSYTDTDTGTPTAVAFTPRRPLGLDVGSVQRAVQTATKTLREVDFFMMFFTSAIVADICGFTNLKGWELIMSSPSYANRKGGWDEVTPDELYRFLGLLIYMGLTSLPDVGRYWGTKSLQGSWAKMFMSRNRFKALLAALHVVDPTTENNSDRLRKLRYLMDHLKAKCQQLYQAGKHLSVDERMVKSKGRSGFKQYMKGKPTPWGFKLWVIATSDSGYTLDFNVYTGSRDGRVTDLASKVVEELVQPFKGMGHTVWFDNFYTSPALMIKLRGWGLNACGTCRVNRKRFPDHFKNIKLWNRTSKRGDMRWDRIEGDVLVVQWKDTRVVSCLSNFHNANDYTEVERLVRKDTVWNKVAVRQPAIISDYNQHMGGVDRSDQMINAYSVLRKTQKWWKTLFFHFVDIAVVNSFLLFQDWQRSNATSGHTLERYSQINFRENLARQLAGIHVDALLQSQSSAAQTAYDSPSSSSFHVAHATVFEESRKNCCVCYKKCRIERKTKIGCNAPECNGKRFCFVSERNCFLEYHSAEGDTFRD
ncbi:piggyBac transposable element-derived protein 4-like [Alosa sapidissima]|uniref:piggyBac transposable element-derived protein 4-like n=1 Tax=Alosa sapidissima TaxID=34773 RepID=UPI001C08E794|nr:piggyBac transposable element-derived protein 4-like [Alosa sapidissima]